MPNDSVGDSVYRMLKSRKLNVYTDISREKANQERISSNPITRGHNDSRDAFRHAYTSAVVAKRYGETISELGGNANELKKHLPGGKVTPEE